MKAASVCGLSSFTYASVASRATFFSLDPSCCQTLSCFEPFTLRNFFFPTVATLGIEPALLETLELLNLAFLKSSKVPTKGASPLAITCLPLSLVL